MHPADAGHHHISWVHCFTDACQQHFDDKSLIGIFPMRPDRVVIEVPIWKWEVQGWEGTQVYPPRTGISRLNWHILCNPHREHANERTNPNTPRTHGGGRVDPWGEPIPLEPDNFLSAEDYFQANNRALRGWILDKEIDRENSIGIIRRYKGKTKPFRGMTENDLARAGGRETARR